jgi:amidohydrolase
MLKDKIKERVVSYHEERVAIRRHLHAHPELSFQEQETARYISEQLTAFGVSHETGIADTGVVALIKGRNPDKKVIALRADIDALPITEANDVPYKSKNVGVMHACGHDVHTTSLLGAARVLQELKDEFEGTVKLIFQPGEEKLPGGASLMIKAGALENPQPKGIFGQHVHPPLEAGKVGFRAGMYMASADELHVRVRGKGGHGALPHQNIDPILITSHIVVALQQIVSRNANPLIPSVLTFGKINSAGGATNVIPEEVKIEGTFRTLNEEWRFEAHKKMKYMAEQIAIGMGGTCDFEVEVGYPMLYNEERLTANARTYAEAYLGKENVVELPMRLTGEDFAYYSQVMPACFYRLGTGNVERGITSSVHTPTFDIDEDALKVGVGLMVWLAVQELAD